MEKELTPILQFLPSDKTIYFMGRNFKLSDEELQSIIEKTPDLWWNEKDPVMFFTYYNDGSYFCERKKEFFDYKNQITSFKIYEFIDPSNDYAKIWYNIIVECLESIRIGQLRKSKEEVKQKVIEEGKILQISLQTYRNSLLKQSDWTQIPDVPLSDNARELWQKYRQYLRDITDNSEWYTNDFFVVDFPKTPYEYVDLYPNKEVEYLSTPDQFNNYGANVVKLNLARLLDYLSSPEIISTQNTATLAGEDLKKLYDTPYAEFLEKVNKYLTRIDPNLKYEVCVVETKCFDNVTEVKDNPSLDL